MGPNRPRAKLLILFHLIFLPSSTEGEKGAQSFTICLDSPGLFTPHEHSLLRSHLSAADVQTASLWCSEAMRKNAVIQETRASYG